MDIDEEAPEALLEPGSTPNDDVPALAPHADRNARVLILVFAVCLCLVGWLGISGIDAAASVLFGPTVGGCGGG